MNEEQLVHPPLDPTPQALHANKMEEAIKQLMDRASQFTPDLDFGQPEMFTAPVK